MPSVQIENQELFPTVEAAKELGVSVEAVNKAVGRKSLRPHSKIGNYNLFHRDEIERYRRDSLRKAGRKRSGKILH